MSVRPGITGATSTRTGTPASARPRIALSRAAGVLVLGSIVRASSASSVVTRDVDLDQALGGHRPQDVEVPQHQGVLGDHGDRLPELGGDLQAAAGQPELPLAGLVGVGVRGQGDRLGHPAVPGEELPEQLRGVVLDEDLRLEVQPGVQPEVLVGRPGEAVARSRASSPGTG